MAIPRFMNNEVFKSLRAGDLDTYHRLIKSQNEIDLTDADLRGTDLRHADLTKVRLCGAYLRDADLRGVDLRQLDLEGCSLLHAKISGAFFPDNITPEEIRLSHDYGTRLRIRR